VGTLVEFAFKRCGTTPVWCRPLPRALPLDLMNSRAFAATPLRSEQSIDFTFQFWQRTPPQNCTIKDLSLSLFVQHTRRNTTLDYFMHYIRPESDTLVFFLLFYKMFRRHRFAGGHGFGRWRKERNQFQTVGNDVILFF
jgi:hypothetical protein